MGRIRKIILIGIMCFGIHCSPDYTKESCPKLSAAMVSLLEKMPERDRSFDVVVTVSDSAGLVHEFPMLTFPNGAVALGHMTRSQIVALCRKKNVLSIDKRRTFYPKQ